MNMGRIGQIRMLVAFWALAGLVSCKKGAEDQPTETTANWPEYLEGPGRKHYSALNQINKDNVTRLKVAWVYKTGDFGQTQCNPLVVDGTLYGITAASEAFALDAATGQEKWRFAAVQGSGSCLLTTNGCTPSMLQPVKKEGGTSLGPGAQVYMNFCSMCHGADQSGNPASGYPSLTGAGQRLSKYNISGIISKGKGMMPGFPGIKRNEKEALLAYLLDEKGDEAPRVAVESIGEYDIPWKFDGFVKFQDSEGMPGISPPWDTLTAIDLNTGLHKWKATFE